MIPTIIITHGGTDITDKVISYERRQDICTGIGTLDLIIEYATGVNIQAWDIIRLRENGRLKGTYYVSSTEKDARTGGMSVSCQDGSKKLSDYFIPDIYNINYATYARYWIEKFLTDAGITYDFTTESNGALLSENFSFGPASAYDTIQSLLQNSGWYLYFDNDNTCIIGELNIDLTIVDKTVEDYQILKLNTTKDDKMLRNRVVVWGNQDSESNAWVWADLTQHTPWDRNNKDIRTTVIANSMIRNTTTAYLLAAKVLAELAKITYIKEITLIGEHNIQIGDVIRAKSAYYSGVGLVTTVGSQGSSSGLLTIVILDQRCPRIFGYVSYLDYVYIGTNGGGVWRKPLDSNEWEAFSTGLDNWNVTDLIIKNGIFACVADGYCYINQDRIADWEIYYPIGLTDLSGISFPSESYEAKAVDIDDYTGNILIGYRLKEPLESGEYRSWVVEITPLQSEISVKQVYIYSDDYQDFRLIDVEKYASERLCTVEAPANYACLDAEGFWGCRKVYPFWDPDPSVNTFGPFPRDEEIEDAIESISYDIGAYYEDSAIIIEGNNITELMSWGNRYFNYYYFPIAYEHGSGDFKTVRWGLPWPYSYAPGALTATILWRKSSRGNDEDRLYHVLDTVNDNNLHYIRHITITPLLENVIPYQVGAVRAATTEAIILYGEQTIDGIACVDGNRVLVKNQGIGFGNGIYIVSNNWWTRVSVPTPGLFVGVLYGETNYRTAWQVSYFGFFTQVLIISIVNDILYSNADQEFPTNKEGLYWLGEYPIPKERNGVVTIIYYGNWNDPEAGGNAIYTEGEQRYYTVTYNFKNAVYQKSLSLALPFRSLHLLKLNLETSGHTELIPTGSSDYTIAFFIVEKQYEKSKIRILTLSGIDETIWEVPDNWEDWINDCPDVYGKVYKPFITWRTGSTFAGECAWTGSALGGGVKSFVKFRIKGFWQGECDSCVITGPCKDIYFHETTAICGVLSTTDGIIDLNVGQKSGAILTGCCETPYGNSAYLDVELNYANIMPFYGTQTYFFKHLSTLYSSESIMGIIGTIPAYASLLSQQTDNMTGGIYAWCQANKKIYILSVGGGDMVVIDVGDIYIWATNFFNKLVYTNGYFIYLYVTGGSRTNAIFILRLDPSTLFDEGDTKLCFLLEEVKVGDFERVGYQILDTDFFDLYTECSQGYPLVSWTKGDCLFLWEYDDVVYSGGGEHLKWYNTEFIDTVIPGGFNDLRTFNTASTLATSSGNLDTDYARYIVATSRVNDLYTLFSESDSDEDMVLMDTFSSGTRNVETSNSIYPYIFVSVSGYGFYQRNPGNNTFNAYFPPATISGEINVVRIDDRI